jgi:hypothetical protein
MKLTIKDDDGRSIEVGNFNEEDKIWYIKRSKRKHFFWKTHSWGLDKKTFESLSQIGLKKVQLENTDDKKTYNCSVKMVLEKGKEMHFFPHGLQIFIPDIYWGLKKD